MDRVNKNIFRCSVFAACARLPYEKLFDDILNESLLLALHPNCVWLPNNAAFSIATWFIFQTTTTTKKNENRINENFYWLIRYFIWCKSFCHSQAVLLLFFHFSNLLYICAGYWCTRLMLFDSMEVKIYESIRTICVPWALFSQSSAVCMGVLCVCKCNPYDFKLIAEYSRCMCNDVDVVARG